MSEYPNVRNSTISYYVANSIKEPTKRQTLAEKG